HVEIAIEQKRALLASVVAPDAGNGEYDGFASEGNGHSLTRRESVEILHRFSRPQRRRIAGLDRGRRADKRQLRGLVERARDQRHAWQRRIEQQTLRSRKRYVSHARQCRDPALIVIVERRGIAAETRARVNVGG